MPYITKFLRTIYDTVLDKIKSISSKGDLEYCVFKLMKIYMKTRKCKYSDLHDCVYAVQHCADEFRRRYLDKREDKARETNGDIDV